jgi:nucleoside-diphosphate-sugar epimerase
MGDLCESAVTQAAVDGVEEVYQLAADMGGAGYIFTGLHDAAVMRNSATINLNVLEFGCRVGVKKFFYSSSACIYPEFNQMDPDNPKCSEDSAYPALPDSEYGWEKLFSERLYMAYMRNCGVQVRIARFHNIFGPEGTWDGGREKAPAAMCRKVAQAPEGGEIEIWGDGLQTRYTPLRATATICLCSQPSQYGQSFCPPPMDMGKSSFDEQMPAPRLRCYSFMWDCSSFRRSCST